jgi:glycosyltransferase involved in cell wall biosynthesis
VRILHIDTGGEMRGGQYQVLLLLSGLKSAGHESTLMARNNGPLSKVAAAAGFAVLAADTKELWRCAKEATIVHAHDARAHTMAAIASRRKFVVSRRVAFPVRRSVASLWKYQRAARFLAVSQFVAKELQAAGIRKEKIDVVYDGVEMMTPDAEWNPQNPVVALASNDLQKGRDLVDEAAREAGVRVLFSDDLMRDLPHGSLFVYITRSEGLGSAVLLAMSTGVPVVASCVGGLVEVFADGVSGIFVHNDSQEISRAIRQVLDNPALAHNLIQQGKARIAECFTKEHLTRGTIAAYERALAT